MKTAGTGHRDLTIGQREAEKQRGRKTYTKRKQVSKSNPQLRRRHSAGGNIRGQVFGNLAILEAAWPTSILLAALLSGGLHAVSWRWRAPSELDFALVWMFGIETQRGSRSVQLRCLMPFKSLEQKSRDHLCIWYRPS